MKHLSGKMSFEYFGMSQALRTYSRSNLQRGYMLINIKFSK